MKRNNILDTFNKLDSTTRTMLMSLIVIVGGVILLFLLKWTVPEKPQTSLPSLLNQKSSLPTLLNDIELPSLIKPANKNSNHTIEDLMCRELYTKNMHNITLGGTTCFRWNSTEYDCVCLTPLK